MSEDCFQETSSPQLPNSPPADQLPPLLPESPIITESRVPLILENSVTGEDTNSLPTEPPKQQLCVYSQQQPSQQIKLNTSRVDLKSELEIEPKSDSNSPLDVQGETCEETGNLSVTMFHSGHLSHLLKLTDQPYRRKKTLTADDFSGEVLFRHRPYHQVRKEEIFKFSQSTGGRFSATRRPRAFLLRGPKPHAPAREGAWSTFRPRASTSSLA
ncbi:hypothetical protein CK203_081407 [Vitis vinifera]|uniref:Uncharacterized protein n=1 Tax=Vitis vinifera TaxID=29760 RepID=A0A438DG25_VITVI|nr:hypothetical protein CK203_081407 [Vitis vinifera]